MDITKYLTDLKIYDKNNTVIGTLDDLNANKDLVTVRVLRSSLETVGGTGSKHYKIPISYQVKTGDDLFNNEGGHTYSNYMVSVTAAVYNDSTTTNYNPSSYAYNYLIYTNAKVDPEVKKNN